MTKEYGHGEYESAMNRAKNEQSAEKAQKAADKEKIDQEYKNYRLDMERELQDKRAKQANYNSNITIQQ